MPSSNTVGATGRGVESAGSMRCVSARTVALLHEIHRTSASESPELHGKFAGSGQSNLGRVQVRAVIQVAFMDGSVRPFELPISIELVDNRTGATIGGSYSTGYVKVSDDGPGD